MTTLSTKFAALGIALTVNSMMIGAVSYLFSGQIHAQTVALAQSQAVIGLFV